MKLISVPVFKFVSHSVLIFCFVLSYPAIAAGQPSQTASGKTATLRLIELRAEANGQEAEAGSKVFQIPLTNALEVCFVAQLDNLINLSPGINYRAEIINTTDIDIYVSVVHGTNDIFFSQPLQRNETLKSRVFRSQSNEQLRAVVSETRFDQKATGVVEEAVAAVRGDGNPLINFTNIAAVAGAEAKYNKLIALYKEELEKRAGQGNYWCEGNLRNGLGIAYLSVSNYGAALNEFETALEIGRSRYFDALQAAAFNNLGLTYGALNNPLKAAESYQKAIELKRRNRDTAGVSVTLINLGVLLLTQGNWQEAERRLNEALRLVRQSPADEGETNKRQRRQREGLTLSSLARVKSFQGLHQEAIELAQRALKIAEETGNRAGVGFAYNNIAAAFAAQNKHAEAVKNYDRALLVFREVGNRAAQAVVLSNLMNVWSKIGKEKSRLAIFHGKQAVDLYQEIRRGLKSVELSSQNSFVESRADTYRVLASLLIAEGRIAEAERVISLLKQEEYKNFTRGAAQAESETLAPEIDDKELENYNQKSLTLAEASRRFQELRIKKTLSEQERAELIQRDSALQTAQSDFEQFFRQLQAKLSQPALVKTSLNNSKSIMETLNRLEAEMQQPANVAAIYAIVGKDDLSLAVITPKMQRGIPPVKFKDHRLKDAAEFNKLISRFRHALQKPGIDPRPLGARLYKMLFKPLEAILDKALNKETTPTLMLSLDGSLRYIPIAALWDEERKQYLVERYRTAVFTQSSISRLEKPYEGKWTALGFGVSEERGAEFPALAAVPCELAVIRNSETRCPETTPLFEGEVFLNKNFKREKLKSSLLVPPPLVHIASHFKLTPGGDLSENFLLLGEGQLSVADLKKDFNQSFQGIELLTLSACNTATEIEEKRGDGSEVENFAEFAQENGARAVIATLWQVDDAGTAQLITQFYKLRSEKPQLPKVEILRLAQIELLNGSVSPQESIARRRGSGRVAAEGEDQLPPFEEDPKARFAHPYFWSSTILIGNWR